jgi:beta-lactamase regulating signal transducer with metallopeptidase domain
MSALFTEIDHVATVGLAALLNTLWYAAAVVALTYVGLRYMRGVNAATRYWIWTLVLGFLLALPFLPGLMAEARTALLVHAQAPAAVAPWAGDPLPSAAHRRLDHLTLTVTTGPRLGPWPLSLVAVWMFATIWQLARLLRGVASVRRLKVGADAAPSDALPLRLRRRVWVLTSTGVTSPVAAGYIHPAVVIPPGLLALLEEGERQDVLLHELVYRFVKTFTY